MPIYLYLSTPLIVKSEVKVLVVQLRLTVCDPMDCSLPGSSVHGDSPAKNTRVGCHALLQGIFPIQGLNPGLLHCRQILYHLSHQGSPSLIVAHVSSKNTLVSPLGAQQLHREQYQWSMQFAFLHKALRQKDKGAEAQNG